MANGLKKLTAWEKKLATIDDPMDRAKMIAAMEFRRDISKNFDKEASPYGKKWSPRKREYKHGALKKTRKMRRSWRVVVRGDEILFKSSDPKTIFHQRGTRLMNARPVVANTTMPRRYSDILKKNSLEMLSIHFGRAV